MRPTERTRVKEGHGRAHDALDCAVVKRRRRVEAEEDLQVQMQLFRNSLEGKAEKSYATEACINVGNEQAEERIYDW